MKANFVGVNDEEIAMLAIDHLVEQGCRRIAHIRGPEVTTSIGRLLGYRRALATHRLKAPPEYVTAKESTDGSGYDAMRRLLRLRNRPDGVFAFNDAAAGAIKAVLEAGLRVPQDVAVVGAGNVHYSDLLRVPVTTVDQSSLLIGQTAADLLLEAIEAKTPTVPRRILFSPHLIVRESSLRRK